MSVNSELLAVIDEKRNPVKVLIDSLKYHFDLV